MNLTSSWWAALISRDSKILTAFRLKVWWKTRRCSLLHMYRKYENNVDIAIYQIWPVSWWASSTNIANTWTNRMAWKQNKSPIPLVRLPWAFELYRQTIRLEGAVEQKDRPVRVKQRAPFQELYRSFIRVQNNDWSSCSVEVDDVRLCMIINKYSEQQCVLRDSRNCLNHLSYVFQGYSKGISKRLPIIGKGFGPGGTGSLFAWGHFHFRIQIRSARQTNASRK